MPVVNGYVSLVEARERMSIADSGDDNLLEAVITAASRWIDDHTGRRFYGGSETRYYTASSPYGLSVPDEFTAVTTLKTDEDGDRVYEMTWATTDYYLLPFNAAVDGRPYDRIEVDQVSGTRRFPSVLGGVEIVGDFGYGASGAPPMVKEACFRLVARFYDLRTATLGVTGSADMGTVRIVSDRDVMDWLGPYVRRRRFA